MTRHVYLDRAENGGFTVRVLSGARSDRTHVFTERAEAVAFARARMGRAGTVLDMTTMTEEQLAEHRAREARTRALLKAPVP